jgi:hypothetical protein
MIRTIIVLLLLFLALPNYAISASRVYYLDFESSDWSDDFRSGAWIGKVDRSTSNPHGGSYALRGNLLEGQNDPITGLAGESNPQLEWDGSGIVSSTASQASGGEVYISYWRRIDASNWGPCSGECGKGEYITDVDVETSAWYTNHYNSQSQTNVLTISDNGTWFSWAVSNWGYQRAYLTNPTFYIDGQWHKIAYYINYDEDYMQMWVDGVLCEARSTSAGYFTTQIPIPTDFTMRGLQFFYVDNAQVSSSTDNGTEYACGYQFDDIEVWDGMPDSNQVLSITIGSGNLGATVGSGPFTLGIE